jgi:hypothetical protein
MGINTTSSEARSTDLMAPDTLAPAGQCPAGCPQQGPGLCSALLLVGPCAHNGIQPLPPAVLIHLHNHAHRPLDHQAPTHHACLPIVAPTDMHTPTHTALHTHPGRTHSGRTGQTLLDNRVTRPLLHTLLWKPCSSTSSQPHSTRLTPQPTSPPHALLTDKLLLAQALGRKMYCTKPWVKNWYAGQDSE